MKILNSSVIAILSVLGISIGFVFSSQEQRHFASDFLAQNFQEVSQSLLDFNQSLNYEKKIYTKGLELVDQSYVQNALQTSGFDRKSVWWWWLNKSTVESSLRANPFIDQVKLESCQDSYLRCYIINITERQPEFVAEISGSLWLIGADGKFLMPIQKSSLQRLKSFKYIKGLEGLSPQSAQGQINYIISALKVVQQEISQPVTLVEYLDKAELRISFEQIFTKVRFSYVENDFEVLREKTKRFKQALNELGDKAKLVNELDLGFDKVGVVKFQG